MLRPALLPLTHVCLYILLGIPQAKCQEELTMRPYAFDDQYIGCEKEMDGRAPGLLKDEMFNSRPFRIAWNKSKEEWQSVKTKTKLSLPSGFNDEHGIAIRVYTDKEFHPVFAREEEKMWTSPAEYRAKFQFKALHYYLTRALRLLRGSCALMYSKAVYRGTKHLYSLSKGIIRFGNFTSSSISREVAVTFGTATFFTIHTCFGVNISAFSYESQQKEVLIPVHEQFNVFKGEDSNSFVLWSTNQTCSYFNCTFLNGEKNKDCVDNSATRGGIAFPSQTSPSLFGGSIILFHVAALKLFASF